MCAAPGTSAMRRRIAWVKTLTHLLRTRFGTERSGWTVLLFVVYFVCAKLAIELSAHDPIMGAFWIPSGVALAAFVLLGTCATPAVFLASLLASVSSGTDVPLAAALGIGNTIGPCVAASLLRRMGFDPSLRRMPDVAMLSCAAVVGAAPASIIGTTWFALLNNSPISAAASQWVRWWYGDLMGMLVVAPLLLAIVQLLREHARPTLARTTELLAAYGLLLLVCTMVFSGDDWYRPAMLIPIWILATLRFRAFGTTLVTITVAIFGMASLLQGAVVVDGATVMQSARVLQGVLTIIGMSLLVIAAALDERDESKRLLQITLGEAQSTSRHLREIGEAKDVLLSAVAHELRTPLTSIRALSTLLEDGHRTYTPAKRDELCEHLSAQAQRLDAMLADLLDLERLRLGIVEPRYEQVDVPAIVRQVIQRYAKAERSATMNFESVSIDADAAKLERIVDNLVGNAYKHTPHHRPISVSVRAVDGGAMIAVDDEGHGVHDDDKQSIFEPFNRGSHALKHAPGVGIGLSLVAHFTDLHGGRSWVEDRATGGSSFRVFLPGTRVVSQTSRG